MTKEQMKEIMREKMQVAEDNIYDDVIANMESRFEELKKSGINIPIIKEIGDMSFEDTVDKIVETWNKDNTTDKRILVAKRRGLVNYFAPLPQHWSYVDALFSSKKATN